MTDPENIIAIESQEDCLEEDCNKRKRKERKDFLKQIPKHKKEAIKNSTKTGDIFIDLDFNDLMTDKVFCLVLYFLRK